MAVAAAAAAAAAAAVAVAAAMEEEKQLKWQKTLHYLYYSSTNLKEDDTHTHTRQIHND